MQEKLVLNPNSKDRFALAEKFCYFGYAPAKSGVGIKTLLLRRDYSSYLVMVDRLRRSMWSAASLRSGSLNLERSATIRLRPNDDGKDNLIRRGTTMINSWCSLLRDVCRQISNSFRGEILGKGVLL